MDGEISWHVELVVKAGELDNFRALTNDMVAFSRGEPGTLVFERFVSDDGRVVHVYERYADSAAAVSHLSAFASRYSERFSQLVERRQFTVFGNPSDELRELLDRFGATSYLTLLDGFSRLQSRQRPG